MAEVAEYRFLPWTRRGLVTQAGPQDGPEAALPERATVRAGLTVTGVGATPEVDLSLYGPGDVLGVDPRLIVRTDPRPGSIGVEPNYLPAVEFDPPDLPWMFTPAQPGTNERLRPWLVLACVDRAVVDPPHLRSSGGRRGPLPVIELPASAVATELPDLRESWAWAHTQMATADDAGPVTPDSLAAAPTLNVSRLLCPRRLQPGQQYVACVVPAFGAGVYRGLTGTQPTPTGAATLAPAWHITAPVDLVLPVYFHWEFSTGPAGDFEELARKLQPFACPPTVGYASMHVGHGGPQLPEIAAGEPGASLDMDGALRAPAHNQGALDEVGPALRQGLRRALDAPAEYADGSATAQTPVLGPPLYGGWHAQRHRVPQAEVGGWFTEANLDPRGRAAAGVATEVARRNQEHLMHAAWQQVGQVRAANALLTWGRLALEAGRRLHERHLRPLPAHRLVPLAAPMRTRVLLDGSTVRERVRGTSLPDAAADPALRRLTGGRHRLIRRAAGDAAPGSLYTSLAGGRQDVDPNRFERDGLAGIAGLAELDIPSSGADPVSLAGLGLPVELPADLLRDGRIRYRAVEQELAGTGEGMTADAVTIRDDIRATGIFTAEHIQAVAQAPVQDGASAVETGAVPGLLQAVLASAEDNPQAIAFHIDTSGVRPQIGAIEVDADGNIFVRTRESAEAVRIGIVSESLIRVGPGRIGDIVGRLEPGALPSAHRPLARPPVIGEPGGPVPLPLPATKTVPAPIRDAAVLSRFESAWTQVRTGLDAVPPVPGRSIVAFPVSVAVTAVLAATDPVTVIPRRLDTMLSVRGNSLLTATDHRLQVAGTADRVLAFPELPMPVYDLLARHDPDRFLPGVDVLPPNAVTLLETNPRFIEAFLVGLNHEMNRELLWREYPTDRRGTPLRHFWSWVNGEPDIEAIHTWPATNALGGNTRGGRGGQIVLLIRGDLLRRYPSTAVYAWAADGNELKDPPGPGDIVRHDFAGRFDPDVSFFGFRLTEGDLADGWFFVLQEQPTEPRFGFDAGSGTHGPVTWADATWADTGTEPGAHLRLEGNPLHDTSPDGATANSGRLAAVTLQRPVRVAVASSEVVAAGSDVDA